MKKRIAILLLYQLLSCKLYAQWQILYSNNLSMIDMSFPNPSTGFFTGSPSVPMLVRTVNNGVTWDTIPAFGLQFRGVHFINADTGFTSSTDVSWKYIYKTTDGGNTWIQKYQHGFPMKEINFPSYNCGYAFECAVNPILINKSIDGGETWNFLSSVNGVISTTFGVEQSFFFNCDSGFIATDGGEIYKTNNGGLIWTNVYSNYVWEINAIKFINDMQGIAVGHIKDGCIGSPPCGVTLLTQNRGNTWTEITATPELHGMDITNSGKVWATAWQLGQSYILTSPDSGLTWNKNDSISSYRLQKIKMFSDSVGYVFGNKVNGSIIMGLNIGTGLKENENLSKTISIYPNPFSDKISIINKFETFQKISISITNTFGQIVFKSHSNLKQAALIDLNYLPSGIYFIQVSTLSEAITKKILKK